MEAEDDDTEVRGSASASKGPLRVTDAMVNQWVSQITKNYDQSAFKSLITAFRWAVQPPSSGAHSGPVYKIESDSVYQKVVTEAMRCTPLYLRHRMPLDIPYSHEPTTKPTHNESKLRDLMSSGKGNKADRNLLRSYLWTWLHLCENTHDSGMIRFILQEARPMLHYFLSIKSAQRFVLRVLYEFASVNAPDEAVQVAAFMLLRQIVMEFPRQFYEPVCKSVYVWFTRAAKNLTPHTLGAINLMAQFGVELYGINRTLGYQLAFSYLRQLAIHLRNARTAESREAVLTIYNWQFISCLRFWTDVLASHAEPEPEALIGVVQPTQRAIRADLRSLIYPLAQLINGTARLNSNYYYFPLRFHCVRMMNQLARATGTFIPTGGLLLDVLYHPEMSRKVHTVSKKPMDFNFVLKAPEEYERTLAYVVGCLEQTNDLAVEHLYTHAKNIAFPEMSGTLIAELKRFIRKRKLVRYEKSVEGLLRALKKHRQFIETERSARSWTPKDFTAVKTFLATTPVEQTPFGEFYKSYSSVKRMQIEAIQMSETK
ncbi:Noc2p family-domain-containing protein [Dimargaris cristalligena]|uniref:Noc2p family-domain-containing protein n=1 Tax=Dimargaris cristalligena TaxID=215637 RepID=A0A4Q0A0P7_9FUNG|nr:Noc2p family-domain-containing protein [Dimargaris cristalligena]|eukprot:RKP39623.1 Noc2p family-domain-containing protein [Dimargaris cristalligena]